MLVEKTVTADDTSAFLATVLERVEAKVSTAGALPIRRVNSIDAALIVRLFRNYFMFDKATLAERPSSFQDSTEVKIFGR